MSTCGDGGVFCKLQPCGNSQYMRYVLDANGNICFGYCGSCY